MKGISKICQVYILKKMFIIHTISNVYLNGKKCTAISGPRLCRSRPTRNFKCPDSLLNYQYYSDLQTLNPK